MDSIESNRTRTTQNQSPIQPRQVKSNDHPKFLPPTIQPKPNNVSEITPPQSPAFFPLSFPLALYLLPLDERVKLVDVDGAFELLELCGMVVVLDGLRRLVGSVGWLVGVARMGG